MYGVLSHGFRSCLHERAPENPRRFGAEIVRTQRATVGIDGVPGLNELEAIADDGGDDLRMAEGYAALERLAEPLAGVVTTARLSDPAGDLHML